MESNMNRRASRLAASYAGNSARILAFIPDVLAHVETHRDTSPLAILHDGIESRDAAILWKIVKACVAEESMSKGKADGGKTVFKLRPQKKGGFRVNGNVVAIVRQYVNEGASFRSKSLAEEIFPEKAKPAFDVEEFVKAMKKKLEKDIEKAIESGVSVDRAHDAIERALQEAYVAALPSTGAASQAA